jgi:hypothetical protein
MNLLQVRRILDNYVLEPQDDPEDFWFFIEHALDCVAARPTEFLNADSLTDLLRRALDIPAAWDWKQNSLPPEQSADDWWEHPAWLPVKQLLAEARGLLPPIGPQEQAELDRQASENRG